MKQGSKDRMILSSGLCLLIASISFWFWKENNLPVPVSLWNSIQNNNDSGLFDFVILARNRVIEKNFEKRTSQLDLEGTRWLDRDTGAILEFSSDQVIRWIKRPDAARTEGTSSRTHPLLEDWLHEASYRFDRSDATNFVWEADSHSHSGLGNLHLPGSGDFQAGIGFDGKRLGLWATGPEQPAMTSSARDPFFHSHARGFKPRLYLWFEETPP